MLEACFTLGLLGIESIQDIREKKLTVWLICAFGVCGAVCHLIYERGEYQSLLGGIAVGAAMIAVSLLTKGRVGLGDGLVLFVTGIFLGFRQNLTLFMVSQVLTAVYALFLLTIRKKGRGYEIPFVPFLLIAYVGMLAL